MATIAQMTLEELKQLIEHSIDKRLAQVLGEFDLSEDEFSDEEETDTRSWEEVKRDIERHRWMPPLGTPSVNQLLREDRDR